MPKRRDQPFRRSRIVANFVNVPRADWLAVAGGDKTELRRFVGTGRTRAYNYVTPCPVIAYTFNRSTETYSTQLMVLEKAWEEPLAAITEESRRNEGFASMEDFKLYWIGRYKTKRRQAWRPLDHVVVWRLRRWQPDDHERFAYVLFDRLYGEHLPK